MSEKGSTSVVVLSLLLFLSVLFMGTAVVIELSLRQLRQSSERQAELGELRATAEQVVRLLLEDPTPFADSAVDPVWARLGEAGSADLAVSLRDESSRLGLNWIRKEPLAATGLLKAGRTVEELQQVREDVGPLLNLRPTYGAFFEEKDLDALFTAYGYFNINVSDEFVLRKVYFLRSGDLAEAERFRGQIQAARVRQVPVEARELREFLGEKDFALVFPVINAEAPLNLHFVPARVLRDLFEHYGVPAERADRILSLREGREWAPGDLEALIGAAEFASTPLRHYLGVQTWFWRIEVTGPEARLSWVLARVVEEGSPVELRLIEESVEP